MAPDIEIHFPLQVFMPPVDWSAQVGNVRSRGVLALSRARSPSLSLSLCPMQRALLRDFPTFPHHSYLIVNHVSQSR
eukprot:COSAG01_NODE_4258_length_5201_cov_4.634065_5_plen_77_part_00